MLGFVLEDNDKNTLPMTHNFWNFGEFFDMRQVFTPNLGDFRLFFTMSRAEVNTRLWHFTTDIDLYEQ